MSYANEEPTAEITLTPDQIRAIAEWAKDADSDYADNDITLEARRTGITVSQHHDVATFSWDGTRAWISGRDYAVAS